VIFMSGYRRCGARRLAAGLLLAALIAIGSSPVFSQTKPATPKTPSAPRATPNAQARIPAAQRPPALPTPALQRLANMTPEQREKALSKLTPERREKIETQLGKLDKLPADQRSQLLQRYDQFQGLPRDRQAAVRGELQALRKLPTPQLRERLNSPEFQQSYSPEEQRILKESLIRKVD